jgi:hypothetical protein
MDNAEGGCLCGAVRFRATGAPLATSVCHCVSCRRASGAPAVAWVVVNATGFAFVTGRPVAFRSSPPVVRTFCGRCGTPLTYRHDESPDTVDVTTASFDFPERFAPTKEIWLEHRIAWQPVNAALPHFPGTSAQRKPPAT